MSIYKIPHEVQLRAIKEKREEADRLRRQADHIDAELQELLHILKSIQSDIRTDRQRARPLPHWASNMR